MNDKNSWDWETEVKEIPFSEWENTYNWVEEPCVTPDGEKIASIVNRDECEFGICVNGELWDETYEKVWNLKACPAGRLCALVANDEEWSVSVNGKTWENRFDYIWDLSFTGKGDHVAVATQADMAYGVAVNDTIRGDSYDNMTGMVVSEQGKTAAVVQTEPLSSGDIESFKKGVFAVSVDGSLHESRFVNVWDVVFSRDSSAIAASVRTSLTDYSVLQDNLVWDKTYQCVWKPLFSSDGKSVYAPVREEGKWFLAKDGYRYWKNSYSQLLSLTQNADGSRIAAIASNSFGKWTVVENDRTWDITTGDMVSDLFYSPDGNCLIASFKDKGRWTLAINGKKWNTHAEKLWAPSVSQSGDIIATRAEIAGRYYILVNDRRIPGDFDMAFQPELNPQGDKLLLKVIQDGRYIRKVVSLNDII